MTLSYLFFRICEDLLISMNNVNFLCKSEASEMRSEMKFTVLKRRKLHIRLLVLRILHMLAQLASPYLQSLGEDKEVAESSFPIKITALVDSFVNQANLLVQFLENSLLDCAFLDELRKYDEQDERTSILRIFNQMNDAASTAVS